VAYRIGVVGLAGVGRQHLHTIGALPEFELAALCDTEPEVLAAADAPERAGRFAGAEAMLAAGGLDAVSVCTPPASHPAITEAAARAGCHVICEKPMASTLEGCERMIATCREAGVVLLIAQKKRFLPAVQRLRELAAELGPIRFGTHVYLHPWRSDRPWFWEEADGGGPLVENAVHAADLLRYVFGDVTRVCAEADRHLSCWPQPQLNCAAYTLRFASGALASVAAGMVSVPALNQESLFVAGEGGAVEISGPFDSPRLVRWGRRGPGEELQTETHEGDAFALEFRHFAACCAGQVPPLISGEEGRRAVEVCLAVKQSARSGMPVELGR